MAGNVVDWVGESEEERMFWQFDFGKVTAAASAIYAYASLVCIVAIHEPTRLIQMMFVFYV